MDAYLWGNRITVPINLTRLPRKLEKPFLDQNDILQQTVWYDKLPASIERISLLNNWDKSLSKRSEQLIQKTRSNQKTSLEELKIKIYTMYRSCERQNLIVLKYILDRCNAFLRFHFRNSRFPLLKKHLCDALPYLSGGCRQQCRRTVRLSNAIAGIFSIFILFNGNIPDFMQHATD